MNKLNKRQRQFRTNVLSMKCVYWNVRTRLYFPGLERPECRTVLLDVVVLSDTWLSNWGQIEGAGLSFTLFYQEDLKNKYEIGFVWRRQYA